jgi:hypothetical protein
MDMMREFVRNYPANFQSNLNHMLGTHSVNQLESVNYKPNDQWEGEGYGPASQWEGGGYRPASQWEGGAHRPTSQWAGNSYRPSSQSGQGNYQQQHGDDAAGSQGNSTAGGILGIFNDTSLSRRV